MTPELPQICALFRLACNTGVREWTITRASPNDSGGADLSAYRLAKLLHLSKMVVAGVASELQRYGENRSVRWGRCTSLGQIRVSRRRSRGRRGAARPKLYLWIDATQ